MAEARRLAGEDVGAQSWARQLTQLVDAAADDDLGTLVVARAVLTKAAQEQAAELARKRADDEGERTRRQQERDAALSTLANLRAEADSCVAQRRALFKSRQGARGTLQVLSLAGVMLAIWVFGISARLDWGVVLLVAVCCLVLISAVRVVHLKDGQTRLFHELREVRSRYSDTVSRHRAVLDWDSEWAKWDVVMEQEGLSGFDPDQPVEPKRRLPRKIT